MPRWFKAVLIGLAIVLAVPLIVGLYLHWKFEPTFWSFSDSGQKHAAARIEFLAALDGTECLTAETIKAEAEARDFSFWVRDQPFHWCHSPVGLSDWVGVEIDPPLMMSTLDENTEHFGFNEAGCAVPWQYDSGAGTTCPD